MKLMCAYLSHPLHLPECIYSTHESVTLLDSGVCSPVPQGREVCQDITLLKGWKSYLKTGLAATNAHNDDNENQRRFFLKLKRCNLNIQILNTCFDFLSYFFPYLNSILQWAKKISELCGGTFHCIIL